jgi:hypothetical protein
MSFAFDSETRRRLGYYLIDAIDDYFESLSSRDIQRAVELRSERDPIAEMPESGMPALNVLEETFAEFVEKGFHLASARYAGFPNPTPTYMGILAEALVATMNPQLSSVARSQLASEIERETGPVKVCLLHLDGSASLTGKGRGHAGTGAQVIVAGSDR